MRVLEKVSLDLNIPEEMLQKAIANGRRYVKHLKIKKSDGTYRRVYQPSKKLKTIQYWLIRNILSRMNVHKASAAYQKNLSIKENAFRHRDNKYMLKLDFKDFFPSITFNDFLPCLDDWMKKNPAEWTTDKDIKDIIRITCFYKDDRLPIGYPTSPIISNVIMYGFDSTIEELLSRNTEQIGNVEYSRYADDMIFSTNKKYACSEIKRIVEMQVKSCSSPQLTFNREKSRLVSRSGGSAIVTGLRICHDGHITIHRKYKDEIRLLLSLLRKGALRTEDYSSLHGHLSYIKHVDPVFYTKVQSKYFEVLRSMDKKGKV